MDRGAIGSQNQTWLKQLSIHAVYRWVYLAAQSFSKLWIWVTLRWTCTSDPGERPPCSSPAPATRPHCPTTDPCHLDAHFPGTRTFKFGVWKHKYKWNFRPFLFWEAAIQSALHICGFHIHRFNKPQSQNGASPVAPCWRICLQYRICRSHGFNPWIGKIPWRRKWQPTPIFLPGKSHGQRSLADYSSWGHKKSDTTKRLNHHHHGTEILRRRKRKKNPGKFKKSKTWICLCTGNYLKSIYIILDIINNLDDLN